MNALKGKKPVLCEWPFGTNLQQAEEMTERAAQAGVLNMVGLQPRRHPRLISPAV